MKAQPAITQCRCSGSGIGGAADRIWCLAMAGERCAVRTDLLDAVGCGVPSGSVALVPGPGERRSRYRVGPTKTKVALRVRLLHGFRAGRADDAEAAGAQPVATAG